MSLILVSESLFGGHYSDEPLHCFAMSFVVNIDYKDGKYYPNNDFSKNEKFKKIVELAKIDDSVVLIGFDCDLMGKAIAETLELNLLNHGITNFMRTSYFDDEYITELEPINLQSYYKYLWECQVFSKRHKESLHKIICIEALANFKYREFALENPNGNSTITYTTKTLISECL